MTELCSSNSLLNNYIPAMQGFSPFNVELTDKQLQSQ